jgi:hypothetical protein
LCSNGEFAVVVRLVMRLAEKDQIRHVGSSAVQPMPNVMGIESLPGCATRK